MTAAQPHTPPVDVEGKALLELDVIATRHGIARITSILATRHFEVRTMDVGPPIDGLRRITVEIRAHDEDMVHRAVKYLYRSPDVVKIVQWSDEEVCSRQAAFITIDIAPSRLPEVIAVAQDVSAEIVEATQRGCTLFVAADPSRVNALINALAEFTIRKIARTTPLRTRTFCRKHRHTQDRERNR